MEEIDNIPSNQFKDNNGYLRYKDSKHLVHVKAAMKKYGETWAQIKDKEVHHINGNKHNNKYDNLILLSREDHRNLEDYLRYLKNLNLAYLFLTAFIWVFSFHLIDQEDMFPYNWILIILANLSFIIHLVPKNQLRKILFLLGLLKKNKK